MNPVLIVGRGTLGSALSAAPWLASLPKRVAALGSADPQDRLDISEETQVGRFFETQGPFSLVINAAALSLVDRCEEFPEEARKINALGAKYLARAADKSGIPLIHISTDYVFGVGEARPILADEQRAPRSVYGLTKLEAEFTVEALVRRHALIRTTWLFGPHREDFVNTTLGRLARGESFGVIADQHGSPTYAKDLADWIGAAAHKLMAASQPFSLKLHGVNRGVTTRYEMTLLMKQLLGSGSEIHPVSQSDFRGWKAVRPAYSALETASTERDLGVSFRDWREALAEYVRSEGARRWINPSYSGIEAGQKGGTCR